MEKQTGRQRQIHHVGEVKRCALGQRIGTVASWRVAQNVVQHWHALGHDILALANGEHVEHVAIQRCRLIVVAILCHAERNGLQGTQAAQQLRGLVGLHREDGLSVCIEMQRIARCTVLQSVMDGGYTAANLHVVYISARQVVVVRISLGHLHPDAVLALQTEYRAGKGIECLRGVERILVGQRYGGLFAGQFAGNIRLIAKVVEVVVAYLLISNLYRIAIDAVVDGVVR